MPNGARARGKALRASKTSDWIGGGGCDPRAVNRPPESAAAMAWEAKVSTRAVSMIPTFVNMDKDDIKAEIKKIHLDLHDILLARFGDKLSVKTENTMLRYSTDKFSICFSTNGSSWNVMVVDDRHGLRKMEKERDMNRAEAVMMVKHLFK